MKLTTVHADYPLVVLREVSATAFGRLWLFFLTYAAAFVMVGAVYFVVDLLGGHGRFWDLSRVSFVELLGLLWFFPAGGLLQLWGILSYSALLLLGVSYVGFDEPASRVLPVVLLLQIFEILRCTCQAGGWRTLLEAEFIVTAVLWAAGLAAYVLYRRRQPRSILGS